jgi:hypothetical protein
MTDISGLTAALAAAASNDRVVPPSAAPSAPGKDFWTLPGFCWNARVTTAFGDLPIQALRLRDPLRTAEGTFAQVAFVDCIRLDEDFLQGFPDAHPVLIQASALGRGRPREDLRLSPHQRIGMSESALRPDFRMARDLSGRPGVMRRPETCLSYYVFHCGRPATVMVGGIWVSVSP